MKSLKTPLRYPGGKSRATKYIIPRFPQGLGEYREPFLGGGSVAIEVTKRFPGTKIWVNDLYEPLYNFWKQLQLNGNEVANILLQLKQRHPDPTSARHLFNDAKKYLAKDLSDSEDIHRAVSFYVVNKCSFSGLTESSSFSKQASESNFSLRGIDNLKFYQQLIGNWDITNLSYQKLMNGGPETFVYLDPPYEIKDNLYGKKGSMHKKFDHDLFASSMGAAKCKCMVSYNASQLIKDRFKDWKTYEFDLTYTMRSVGQYMKEQKDRKEILLLNYEV